MNWLGRFRAPPFLAPLGAARALWFECDLRNGLAREVFFTGQYEPQETALLKALLRPGEVFVDVGAHWGYFSLLAAELVGAQGRVLAIEADPRIHATLERNLALNQRRPGLSAHHVAIAAEEGRISLSGYDEANENWGLSRIAGASGPGARSVFEVPSTPLDAFLDAQGVGEVDLVKMDIEGAEGFALRGMAAGLRRHRYRRLLLELHPAELRDHGIEPGSVVQQLLAAGYRGLSVDHSPAASRAAAYARTIDVARYVSALDPQRPLDSWPHTLWLAPGVSFP
jgi:FkbM family methyltransferase